MSIKQTKPRKGSEPMLYFKGTIQGLKRIKPRTLQRRLEKIGATFYNEEHAQMETDGFLRHTVLVGSALKAGESKRFDLHLVQGVIPVRVLKTRSGRVLIHQMPQTHGVGGKKIPPWEGLINILENGFKGIDSPNSLIANKRTRISGWAAMSVGKPIIIGDDYSLEINAPRRETSASESKYPPYRFEHAADGQYFIKKASPREIVSVNIRLNQKAKKAERKRKMVFYKEQIQARFGIPVKFIR